MPKSGDHFQAEPAPSLPFLCCGRSLAERLRRELLRGQASKHPAYSACRFNVSGDALRAEIVLVVQCGCGFVRAVFAGFSAVFVGNSDYEETEFGFGVEVSLGHRTAVLWGVREQRRRWLRE